MNGAIGRVILRYGAGFILGSAAGVQLAADPDLALVVGLGASTAIAAAVEVFYSIAKRKGWSL